MMRQGKQSKGLAATLALLLLAYAALALALVGQPIAAVGLALAALVMQRLVRRRGETA